MEPVAFVEVKNVQCRLAVLTNAVKVKSPQRMSRVIQMVRLVSCRTQRKLLLPSQQRDLQIQNVIKVRRVRIKQPAVLPRAKRVEAKSVVHRQEDQTIAARDGSQHLMYHVRMQDHHAFLVHHDCSLRNQVRSMERMELTGIIPNTKPI